MRVVLGRHGPRSKGRLRGMMPRMPDERFLLELMCLRELVAEMLEDALLQRWSLGETMQRMLPAVAARVGAEAAFVQSYGEDLALQLFRWPERFEVPRDVFARADEAHREAVTLPHV